MTITYDDIGIYDEQGYTYDGTLIGVSHGSLVPSGAAGTVRAADAAATARGRDD